MAKHRKTDKEKAVETAAWFDKSWTDNMKSGGKRRVERKTRQWFKRK